MSSNIAIRSYVIIIIVCYFHLCYAILAMYALGFVVKKNAQTVQITS